MRVSDPLFEDRPVRAVDLHRVLSDSLQLDAVEEGARPSVRRMEDIKGGSGLELGFVERQEQVRSLHCNRSSGELARVLVVLCAELDRDVLVCRTRAQVAVCVRRQDGIEQITERLKLGLDRPSDSDLDLVLELDD